MGDDPDAVSTMPPEAANKSPAPPVESTTVPSPVIRPKRTSSLPVHLRTSSTTPPPDTSSSSPSSVSSEQPKRPSLIRNPSSSHPYAKKLAPLATSSINTMYAQQAAIHAVPNTSSSKSFHTISEELSPASPISPISPILASRAAVPISPTVRMRPGGSRSAPLFSSSKATRLSLLDKGASTRSLSDTSSSMSHASSASLDLFPTDGITTQHSQSTSSVSTGSSKSARVHGRGGAGRRVRATKRDSEILAGIPSSLPSPTATTFVRPMGRGGLGSRPKNANPNADSPKNPRKMTSTPNIAALLHGRKSKKDSKGKERANDDEVPPLPSSPAHFDLSDDIGASVTNTRLQPPNSLRGRSKARHPGDGYESDLLYSPPVSATSATFEAAFEEYERRKLEEANQRERSTNKLARTLGDVPTGLFDALTGHRAHGGRTKSDAKPMHRPTASLGPTSATAMTGRGRSPFRNSVATFATRKDLQQDPDGKLARNSGDADSNRSSSPARFPLLSPTLPVPRSPGIYSLFPPCDTFPPSPSPNMQSHFPPCDTFSPEMGEEADPNSIQFNAIRTEPDDSTFSLPSTPPDIIIPDVVVSQSETGSRPQSPRSRKRKSLLQIHSHSVSTTSLAPPPNTPTNHVFPTNIDAAEMEIHSNWLVPSSPTQLDFDAILVSGPNRDKAIAYSGEWNVDMREVIHALRELR